MHLHVVRRLTRMQYVCQNMVLKDVVLVEKAVDESVYTDGPMIHRSVEEPAAEVADAFSRQGRQFGLRPLK